MRGAAGPGAFGSHLPFGRMLGPMSMPQVHGTSPVVEFIERHDTLRMILEWIQDRFADAPQVDDSIDWEDGEEHEDDGPMVA